MTDEQANNITREQAIRILHPDTNIEAIDDYEEAGNYEHAYDTACLMAVDALRQPGWVKTAYRVPTWEDAPHGYVANAWSYDENPHREDFTITGAHIRQIEKTDNPNDFWFALPPLPESAGLEGTKINGGE